MGRDRGQICQVFSTGAGGLLNNVLIGGPFFITEKPQKGPILPKMAKIAENSQKVTFRHQGLKSHNSAISTIMPLFNKNMCLISLSYAII